MALTLAEIATLYLTALGEADPRLEQLPVGSTYDALAGANAQAVDLAQIQNALNYRNHFIQTAVAQKLDFLATDRFGTELARPAPASASGLVTFFLNAETSSVTIPAGAVVKTDNSVSGTTVRYRVNSPGTLVPVTQPSLALSVTCTQVGAIGNAAAGAINEIETELSSTLVTCNNDTAISNGADSLDDGDYRQYIYNTLAASRKFSAEAIEAQAKTVQGIVFADATETPYTVKQFDGVSCVGSPFQMARAQLFIGTESGTPTPQQVLDVQRAIKNVRALGIFVEVIPIIAQALDYVLVGSLNPAGVHYADFVAGDFTILFEDMRTNMLALPVCNTLNPSVTFDPAAQLALLVGPGAPYETDFTTVSVQTPALPVTLTSPADDEKKFIPNIINIVGV